MSELSELSESRAQPASRVAIEVIGRSGRALPLELTVRPGTVEVWAAGRCSAVFDRTALRAWLGSPSGLYGFDQVTWSASDTEVAVTVERVFDWWPLAPRDLDRLRRSI